MADNFYSQYPVEGGGGSGVTTLNGESGSVTLTSNDSSVVITTPSAHVIDLSVATSETIVVEPFGSSPNAGGGSASGMQLTLQPADATHPGGISTSAQTIPGQKTFSSPVLHASGSSSTPGVSFSSETNTGWYLNGTSNPSLAIMGTQAFDVNKISSTQINFGFGGAAGGTVGNALSANYTYNGTADFNYSNLSTGTSSLTQFDIGSGPSGANPISMINAAFNTTAYWGGGGLLTASSSLTQLNICSESGSGFIAFNVGGRSLATERMRLNTTNLTLNGGNSLVMNGSSSGAVTIATQGAAGTYNFNLPTTAGSSGQVLTSAGGLGAPMTWSTAGTGTVTSVSLSVPATSLFGVTGSPVTTTGTLGLTTTGTSGGVPYFSSTSQMASSGALTASQLVLGGGAGAAPTSLAAGSQFQVLVMGASNPGYGQVNLAQSAAITGILPVGNGGTGVGSVTVSPTASSFAGWDANKNLSTVNILKGYTTTATAAGTTTLVVGSNNQQYFTGSTTQTVLMPVVSTLALGTQYIIVNLSSGIVTVQSSGANTIQAMAANTQLQLTSIATSGTNTAVWTWVYSATNTGLPITNPMTTLGDIIIGGSSGTPQRLAIGTNGYLPMADSTATNGLTYHSPQDTQNLLVNGGFDWWQAGTTQTVTATGGATPTATYKYGPDQWYVNNVLGGGTIEGVITVSQDTGGFSGQSIFTPFGCKVQITTAPTGTGIQNGCELYQVLDNINSLPLFSNTASFGIWVKALSNVNQIGVQFCYATSEAKPTNFIGSEQLFTVNSSTATFCFINGQSIGSSQTSSGVIGVRIRITNVSSGQAYNLNNGFICWQAMINTGAVSSTFQRNGITAQADLINCYRYYEVWGTGGGTSKNLAIGYVTAANTTGVFTFPYKATKRVNATASVDSAAHFNVSNAATNAAATAASDAGSTADNGALNFTLNGTYVAESGLQLITNNTAARIFFDARI